ncbi:Hypothetical predicted protein [Olea europaea subsp. europaea]|uniref:Uncharacterized protein n=1 Tax=Olea europaea subsp. europaea TaxID=158383 RepID=A0A8S0RMN2_OLEEU|nr:Hypothetical predicted protein [Olea europaea subsp. europaea]
MIPGKTATSHPVLYNFHSHAIEKGNQITSLSFEFSFTIMGKRALLFVVWFAVVVSVGWCWGEDATETAKLATGNMKARVEDSKQSAAETVPDVKEKAGSWADWAMNKLSEGFGSSENSAKDGAQKIKENVKYAASKSTDTLNSAAYGDSFYIFHTSFLFSLE